MTAQAAQAVATTAGAMEHVIDVQNLTRVFGAFRAVDGISFHVRRGEVFGFLGANGAGKSTTIRILCGLLAPSSGQGHVLGYDIMRDLEKVKPHVGYMLQKFSLYPDLTVSENLDFFGGIYGVPPRRLSERKSWAVEMSGLAGQEKRLTSTLSGGLKQRLALGAALLHEPEMIFLDEPTAGVAPAARRLFWDLIRTLSGRGITVFVTTHYMDEVEQCDRIALMSRGRIVALDTPANLKRNALGGVLLNFECHSSIRDVREKLSGESDIMDIQPFGAAFHVVFRDQEDPCGAFFEICRRKGLDACDISIARVTLEDVFITVIGKVER